MATPVCALPGNHDDSDIMRRFFPAGPWRGPLRLPADVWRIVLLNSAVPGRIDGVLDAADLLRLEELLDEQPDAPVLLALHHQPMAVGSPWIDRYPLQDPAALLDLVRRHRQVRGVTWGHIHHAFEQQQGGVRWLGAPSTAANSVAGQARFTLDPDGPACRWFRLYADGSMEVGSAAGQDQPEYEIDQDAGECRGKDGQQHVGDPCTGDRPPKMLGDAGAHPGYHHV